MCSKPYLILLCMNWTWQSNYFRGNILIFLFSFLENKVAKNVRCLFREAVFIKYNVCFRPSAEQKKKKKKKYCISLSVVKYIKCKENFRHIMFHASPIDKTWSRCSAPLGAFISIVPLCNGYGFGTYDGLVVAARCWKDSVLSMLSPWNKVYPDRMARWHSIWDLCRKWIKNQIYWYFDVGESRWPLNMDLCFTILSMSNHTTTTWSISIKWMFKRFQQTIAYKAILL